MPGKLQGGWPTTLPVVDAPVMPGAEAWSAAGGPGGALVVHGFTGNVRAVTVTQLLEDPDQEWHRQPLT
jgi:hypothetical protein